MHEQLSGLVGNGDDIINIKVTEYLNFLNETSTICKYQLINPQTLIVSMFLLNEMESMFMLEEYIYLALSTYKNYDQIYTKEHFYDDVPNLISKLDIVKNTILKDLRKINPLISIDTHSCIFFESGIMMLKEDPNKIIKQLYTNYVKNLFDYEYYRRNNLS